MKINEIFCSVQGEGHYTGTPAVFVRTSGCNLTCAFCDTMHNEGKEMSIDDIVKECLRFQPRHVVITGGEPSLQRELAALVDALHKASFYVQIETNGTHPLPPAIDWVTCSPKSLSGIAVKHPHELKVVYQGQDMLPYETLFQADIYSLQPCDTGNAERNKEIIAATIEYVLSHPRWNLSLQTHKFLGIR